MIFIASVKSVNKNTAFVQGKCKRCGKYTTYEFFKNYMEFSLFFIPIYRWKNKYYIKFPCCDFIYKISNDFGKSIERGEVNNLDNINFPTMPQQIYIKTCDNCGYALNDNFCYCPQCGERVK